MMKRPAVVLTLAVVLLAACATRAPAPDWVHGSAARYPAAQYLLGRGEGTSGEAARERARADLAKTLGVVVAVESEDVQAFRAGADGGYEADSRRRITTRAEQLIEGLVIAETWHDPDTGREHALALLPRLPAAARLRDTIADLDETTRQALGRARAADDPLEKIGQAARAVDAQDERATLQRQLQVIQPTGVGVPAPWSRTRLRADLEALLKRVKLGPHIAAGAPEGFASVVHGAVAAAGLVPDTADAPDYVLEADLALEDLGRQDGWYWQRGVLEIRVRDSATGRVRGTRRWPLKVSALERAVARQRALDAAAELLRRELRATLIEFAAGAPSG